MSDETPISSCEAAGFVVTVFRHRAADTRRDLREGIAAIRFFLRGSAEEVAGEAPRVFARHSLLFRPPDHDSTDCFGSEGATVVQIELAPDRFERYRSLFVRTDREVHVPDAAAFGDLAATLAATVTAKDAADASLLTEATVLQLVRRFAHLPCARGMMARPPAWLDRAAMLLRARFRQPITVASLAGTVSVTPEHLAREFKRHYGRTIGNELRQLRAREALALLEHSELSLSEIAVRCGFYDHAHLCRTTRDLLGVTPGEYRRLLRPHGQEATR